jgi:hypothetical protein
MGFNEWSDNGLLEMMRVPLLRWGGDSATSFNWQNSIRNIASDWYFENAGVSPGFDAFHIANLAAGTASMGTVSLTDWAPKSGGECSFSVQKYGAQKATDPYNSDCGNGVLVNGAQVVNDSNDAYTSVTPAFSQQWVSQILSAYGPARTGGVRIWEMDNEPEWWDGVHIDIYSQPASYDDMMARNLNWAQAVKAADPSALVSGPVPSGWSGMLVSSLDMHDGWGKSPWQYWDNPLDYQAHGSVYWIPYYLQQMKRFEQQNGYRLLGAVDVHGYVTPGGLSGNAGDAAMETLRMTSTRALWDPNYYPPGGGSKMPRVQRSPSRWCRACASGWPTTTPEPRPPSRNITGVRRTRLPAPSRRPTSSASSVASNWITARFGPVFAHQSGRLRF